MPDLRIVTEDLWSKVKLRQEALAFEIARDGAGNALNRAHRRRFLLSGLLTCGCCGAGYTLVTKDRYDCAARRSQRRCANDRTISRHEGESRVLTALKQKLVTPELIAEFARAYQEEMNRSARDLVAQRATHEAALAATQRKMESMMRAIEDGLYEPAMKRRMAEPQQERARLTKLVEGAPSPAVSVHPNLAEV